MWVVKLGGSLNGDPLLAQWLELLVQLGGGRVTVVCGGGSFADEVRRAQSQWHFDDVPAHNMAVLAMAQTAYMAHGLQPALQLASSRGRGAPVMRGGHTALWLPYDALRDRPGPDANWGMTSDSIALDLARRLNAERLVVVKSCAVDPVASLSELGELGVLDQRFASIAAGANFPIDLVHRAELARMRSMLIGEVRLDA
ncbi:aspartate kinase [Piscinibacter aquaticus]|uniref:Aspartate kinase n=1 Tax=Piscinibacter aquaticus TaxID=392597 RepID=A0A5C6U1W8_9BURK|nr:aspartate kinase [Piscinibacter aquaticus]